MIEKHSITVCAICYFSGLYANIKSAKQIVKSFCVFEETVNEHIVKTRIIYAEV